MRKLVVGSAVLVAVLGCFVASASAQKGKLRTPTRWQVVDANGVIVGVPLSHDISLATVMLQVDNRLVELVVRPTHITGREYSELLFASPNCSGIPYSAVQPEVLTRLGTWGTTVAFGVYSATVGSTAFYVPFGPRETVTPVSALRSADDGARCDNNLGSRPPAELQPLAFDFNIPAYTFPLSLRLVE